jgi:hypothetical protein
MGDPMRYPVPAGLYYLTSAQYLLRDLPSQ